MGMIWTSKTRAQQPKSGATLNGSLSRPPLVLINFAETGLGRDVIRPSNALSTPTSTNLKLPSLNSRFGPMIGLGQATTSDYVEATEWARFDTAISQAGAGSILCVVRSASAGGFGSGSHSPFSMPNGYPFYEHYPYTNGLIYVGPMSVTRWAEAASPPSSMEVPHAIIATVTSGAQRLYFNGALIASAASVETPRVGSMRFGGQGFVYMFAAWNRILNSAEIKAYSDNPWQLFAPQRFPSFYGSAGGGGSSPTANRIMLLRRPGLPRVWR